MAINPNARYPGQTTAPSADYPYGGARNQTVLGDNTGTPNEAARINDIFGFQQALLVEAGITPSGDPETAQASQYLEALGEITVSRAKGFSVDGGELVYVDANGDPNPKLRTVYVSPLEFVPVGSPTVSRAGIALTISSDFGAVRCPIPPLRGATLVGIRALVHPGAARTSTDRMTARFFRQNGLSFSGSGAAGSDSQQFSLPDNTTSSVQVISSPPLSFADQDDVYSVEIRAGHNASSSPDIFYGLQLDFEDYVVRTF